MPKSRWVTWGAVVFGALFVLANAGAAAAYLYDSAQADEIARGVRIAGVDVGGLSRTEARARLEAQLLPRAQQPLTVTFASHRFSFDPRNAGMRPDLDSMLDRAVAESRRGGLFSRVIRDVRGQQVPARVPFTASYPATALRDFVTHVARVVDRPAHSAAVNPSAEKLAIVPARWGVTVRRSELATALRQALRDPQSPRSLTIPARPLKPAVTTAALWRKYPAFITVDRGAFRLTLWRHLKPYKRYRIAVGQAGLETPAGLYRIDDKQVNPSWHVPNSAWAGDLAGRVIPPGPDDPIKARWMGFYNGAGIHGTDAISSLGSAASHGCIRMAIPDVEELYDLVPLGTPIYVG